MSTADNNANSGSPCANPECSFTGHAGFDNFCSVCFKSAVSKKQIDTEKSSTSKSEVASAEGKRPKEDDAETEANAEGASVAESGSSAVAGSGDKDEEPPVKVQKNKKRCFECRKKVGILGFECRCGFIYCGKHRYPEDHECDFDHGGHEKAILEKNTKKLESNKFERI
mmetsp:Transcript_13620/g.24274  ORF Transcript_13620/g.24274 Transcript_13620/m.24274 type:complete len:169 (-) Transcript_13620:340-846(-)